VGDIHEVQFFSSKDLFPKSEAESDTLKFGQTFTDHMFIMDYSDGEGWHDGRIVPYGPLALDPAAAVLHYSQQMFEGLKAYKAADGRILLFRPYMNAARTNRTNERMCIPPLTRSFLSKP
jgi:branched-chain amino acid aminotransferase